MQSSSKIVLTKALQIFAALYLLFSIVFGIRLTFSHFALPMDFGSFMASGDQALAGKNPYSYDNDLIFIVPIREYKVSIPSPNLNPPISILPFQILSMETEDPVKSAIVWKILSLIGYVLFVYYLVNTYISTNKLLMALWLLSLAGFWQTIEVGQIYIPLLILAFLVWRGLKNQNPIQPGIFLGMLIAIKPQFIIWAFFLFLINKKSVFYAAVITAFILSIIPAFFYGPYIYIEWINAIRQYTGIILPGNISFQSLIIRLGIQGNNLIVMAVFLLFIAGFIVKTKPGALQTSTISILSILLVSPYSWSGYTLFLLPAYIHKGHWSWKTTLSAGLLSFPFAFVLDYFTKGFFCFLLIGWVYGWAVLVLLWNEIQNENKPKNNFT